MAIRKFSRERLEKKIERVTETGCWLWLGVVNDSGYGTIVFNGRVQRVHRLLWKELIGEIPEGMFLLHRCDIPCCVNPSHLFVGTQNDNMKDMARKKRSAIGVKNCMSKLADEDIRRIFLLRADGLLQREIAVRFGVNRATISYILGGVTWRHVQHS